MAALSQADVDFIIRFAEPGDMAAITSIYSHYVLHGVATFETEPPGQAEMSRRYNDMVSLNMPYLVAVVRQPGKADQVAGYASAGKHKERVAYSNTVDDSIFLSPDFTGRGIGRALLAALIDECVKGDWRQMVSIIADPEGAGAASVSIHRKMGFRTVGVLDEVGWKLGRWIDVGIYQRPLGSGSSAPPTRK